MDITKEGACIELRQMLGAWHGVLLNPDASFKTKERIRRRIHEICNQLDKFEKGKI